LGGQGPAGRWLPAGPSRFHGRDVWLYPRDRWSDTRFRLGPQHDALREAIGSELDLLRSAE